MEIEKLSDKREIKDEIIKENSQFNMDEIFLDENYDGAMVLITQNQAVKSYISQSHEIVAKRMYEAIYGEKMQTNKDRMWQLELADEDIICIQICKDGYQIVFLPNEILTKQYNMMQEIMEQFSKTEVKMKKQLKEPLDFMLAIKKENGDVEDGILSKEEIMKKASEIIKDDKIKTKRKEEILSIGKETIGSFARNARKYRKGGKNIFEITAERNSANALGDR